MHSFISALVLLASGLGVANSTPLKRSASGCDVSNDVLPVPQGQTTLVAPTDAKPIYIGAGIGTQNYTCSDAGTYSSIGAVATLYDASCVYNAITESSSIVQALSALGTKPKVLGHHYFVANTLGGTAAVPKFDFTQQEGPNAFILTAKKAGIPSPSNPASNVDWLELAGVEGQGDLADYVYRIYTIGGQPPKTCSPGSGTIAVPYGALYWFFK